MLRKFDLVLSAALCCAVLTSCGGSPTPTPTPAPGGGTPTPTPSATPVVYDFAHAFVVSSGGIYISANFTPTGGTEVFSDASRLAGLSGLAYEIAPEKIIFGFADLTSDVSYLGTERTSATATGRTYVRDTTSLTVEKPFTHSLRVTYKRTDPFTRSGTAGTLQSSRVTLFTLPIADSAPIASNLTFTGTPQIVGGTSGTTVPGSVTSTVTTFTIAPITGTATAPTITGTIRVFETVGGVTTEKAVLAFSGTLTTITTTPPVAGSITGAFSGAITDTVNGFSGAFSGTLSGANRDEAAIVFSASHADGRKYVGSLLAD